MKLETSIVLIKGACVLLIGGFTPLTVSLAQYANTGEWPARIVWWGVVIPACVVGAANALMAWLSNSFGGYMKERKESQSSEPNKPVAVGSNATETP